MRYFRKHNDEEDLWETLKLDDTEVEKIRQKVIEEALKIEALINTALMTAKVPDTVPIKEVLRYKLIPSFESMRDDYAESQVRKDKKKKKDEI